MESSETFPFVVMQGRAIANWTLGRIDEYQSAITELEATISSKEFDKFRVRPEDFLAGAYAWVGRNYDAFAILEELVDPPTSWGPIRWQVDPIYSSLHDDPRWMALPEREEITPHHIESYELERRSPGPGKVPTYQDYLPLESVA